MFRIRDEAEAPLSIMIALEAQRLTIDLCEALDVGADIPIRAQNALHGALQLLEAGLEEESVAVVVGGRRRSGGYYYGSGGYAADVILIIINIIIILIIIIIMRIGGSMGRIIMVRDRDRRGRGG